VTGGKCHEVVAAWRDRLLGVLASATIVTAGLWIIGVTIIAVKEN